MKTLFKMASLACLLGFSVSGFAQQDSSTGAPPGTPQPTTLHQFENNLFGRPSGELPVDKLKVPPGFKVEVWAEGVVEARSLALGDKGTVFVSNRLQSNIYAVTEKNGKREVKVVLKGLNSPNGIVFDKGTLYVAERDKISRYDGIEDKLDNPPKGVIIVGNLDPNKQPGHFWKFLARGPDGKLYFNIGSEIPGDGAGRQAVFQYRFAAKHHHADLYAGGDPARRSQDRRAGDLCRRRAQQRRHRLPSEDQGNVVHR
jgi:glucose/arabinose dehydrogenase